MTMTQERHTRTGGALAGRAALVTGGTAGIGGAISQQLAGAGATVAAGYWRHQDRAAQFQADMAARFPDRLFTVHEGNIGSAEDCRRVVAEVIERHGRLDILVNNAGITIDKTVAKMADEDWQRVIAVNLSGQANYAASKSGLFGLTKSLAKEAIFQLKRAGGAPGEGVGLTVNAVTPGYVATDMVAAVPEKALDRIKEQIPLGRLAQPGEIARAVCFLAADESSYITGQIWAINGGLDM
jgi:acetoacetyl-CoA reductase